MRQFRELNRFLLCFFIGIFAGTVIANWLTGQFQAVPGIISHYLEYREELAVNSWEIRLWQALIQQGLILLCLWLVGKHNNSQQGFQIVTMLAGLWLGMEIAWLTCLYGLIGMWVFLKLSLPQGIGYAPVWCVMAWSSRRFGETFSRREIMFIGGWYLLGILLEVFVNPLFIIYF